MRVHRGVLVAVLLVVLTGIAAVTIVGFGMYQKPDPQTASRSQLVRYLAMRDMTKEPEDFQRGMVDRMAAEIRTGLSGEGSSLLPRTNRERLEANAKHLKKRWFVWRVNEYATLAPEARGPFLDREIETVLAWAKLESQLTAKDGAAQGTSAAAFFDDIKGWMATEVDTAQRDRMSIGVRDGLIQWLATRDLAEQPMEVRQQLALRIADSLSNQTNDGQRETLLAARSADEQARLQANGLLLVEAWLLERARAFAPLGGAERIAFVDQQIDTVLAWKVDKLVAAAPSGSAANPLENTAKALAQVETFIQRAPPEDQAALREMTGVVQARLAMRWLTGTLRLGS